MTILVFLACLCAGFWVAGHTALGNDEYYSQVYSVYYKSYADQFLGRIPEGCNSPFFYSLQKLFLQLIHYQVPAQWLQGHWSSDASSQILLRINSVIFMSAGMGALFYYFYRRNSWGWGLYALAVTVTSSLFWVHWTEARPYGAWFALSIFQILILLNIAENPGSQDKKNWFCLILVHWLLALTSTISVVQIVAAGVVIGAYHRPKLLWYLPLALIPLVIAWFYYIHAPHYNFFFVDGPMALINANVPKDRLFIIFICAGLLVFQCRQGKWNAYPEIKYLVFFLLMLGGFGLILLKLKHDQVGVVHNFQISSRYFLPLTPAGIIGTVLFSVYGVGAFPSRWWKAMMVMVLACFLVFRCYKTEQLAGIKFNSLFYLRAFNAYPKVKNP